jgi:SWI/SNF-related matrix-associated actin-dependent regulator of chromatin subfamily A member 5
VVGWELQPRSLTVQGTKGAALSSADTKQLVRTPLWQHQIDDLEHLKEQPAVLIGNDMGSGKTLTAVERDLRLRLLDPDHQYTLVVSPLNTHDGWYETYKREQEALPVKVINPKRRNDFLDPRYRVFIMHPEALRLMPELRDFGFTHIIADECHKFKNRKAAQTKALKKIKVPYKTAMSGSPATDHPHDLWSILNWLKPQTYSSYWSFYKKAVEFEIIYPQQFHKITGPSRWWEEVGLNEIRPFYVRHLKEEMMDLPPKTYRNVYVNLEGAHRRAYDQMDAEMIAWVGQHENEPIVAPAVISRLQRLQQLALAYLEYDEETMKVRMTDPSPKLDMAASIIEDNPDEAFVVFSQFKAPLKMLARRLDTKKIPWASFTGDDSQIERAEGKARFTGGEARVFLSTIRAGGVGVDGLQHVCSNAIFLDRDWSPMINQQAEDRLHRGGQIKHVHIIDIMARNTVDWGRKQKIELKWDWIKRMLGDKKRDR